MAKETTKPVSSIDPDKHYEVDLARPVRDGSVMFSPSDGPIKMRGRMLLRLTPTDVLAYREVAAEGLPSQPKIIDGTTDGSHGTAETDAPTDSIQDQPALTDPQEFVKRTANPEPTASE